MQITKKNNVTGIEVMVEWVELGEGISGDYNSDDPTDIELLRFDVSYRNFVMGNEEWRDPGDASYCTQMPVKATNKQKMDALKIIMHEVFEPLSEGQSIKKLCERLSWISLKTLESKYLSEMEWVLG